MKKTNCLSAKLDRLNQNAEVQQKPVPKTEKPLVKHAAIIAEKTFSKPDSRQRDEYSVEEQDDIIEIRAAREEACLARQAKAFHLIHMILILSCIYVGFLIYGITVTTYEYDPSGTPAAQRMCLSDLSAKKQFDKVYTYYEACRDLYESTLLLDYRLGAGVEDPLTIAPEYESLLDTVESLSVRTDALSVDSAYSQVKSMMLSWIQDDIAVYLQNMSEAISANDTDTANNALQDKDRVYDNFMLVTENMASLGENIKGVDLTSIRQWTPENYIDEEINGES